MGKRGIALFLVAALLAGSLSGCAGRSQTKDSAAAENRTLMEEQAAQAEEQAARAEEQTAQAELTGSAGKSDAADSAESEILDSAPQGPESDAAGQEPVAEPSWRTKVRIRDAEVTPSVEPYTVEPDLSNVANMDQLYYLDDGLKEMLAKNGFAAAGSVPEFFQQYENNRYLELASFVTVDSLMHTYHLYFTQLQKNIEKEYLSGNLLQLSRRMLDNSVQVYEKLKGSEWENAARRNVAFFTVGAKLLDESTEIAGDVKDIVQAELDSIAKAEGIAACGLTGGMEDYSQYAVRGYYEGDEALGRYFRAMMWYGRLHFKQQDEDLDRSALLISMILSEDEAAKKLWDGIYEITSFFAGASDDPGAYEYIPLLHEAYGDPVTADALLADADGFSRFHKLTGESPAPRINSVPAAAGEESKAPGFRFMGQRFTIDAFIMQKLVHESTKGRMLPDVLDVPAALGSDAALEILGETKSSDYEGYERNMAELKETFAEDNEDLWTASLYSCWLNTLRPLLEEKGEGYPMFMQSREWLKKDLECFAGSFTELKHDTVLYTKQVMAEMGGASGDDRGYVEPEPEVYARFAELSDRTALGLAECGFLSDRAEEDLKRLSEIADTLLEISKKELREELPAEEEFEFIKNYGGAIEHFWLESLGDGADKNNTIGNDAPAALVVDIATDPAGQVLEAATGDPSTVYVAVKVDGKVKIAIGAIYSFYQFAWPLSDRLTDSRWHQMIGVRPNADGNYEKDPSIQKPEWTESYRYHYEWE